MSKTTESLEVKEVPTIITVNGTSVNANYHFKGDHVDKDTGDIDLSGINGKVRLSFTVQSSNENVKFYAWQGADAALYIDGLPTNKKVKAFSGYTISDDSKTVSIEDAHNDKNAYNYLLWLTNGKKEWAMDPTIQN